MRGCARGCPPVSASTMGSVLAALSVCAASAGADCMW